MATVQLSSLVERFAFLDPAGSKRAVVERGKRVQARSAIVVIAVDPLARYWVLYAWADRCNTATLVTQIHNVQRLYRPQQFGIEANAMQALFADSVSLISELKGVEVPITPVTQPTGITKEWRIRTAVQIPWIERRLFFHTSQVELVTELTTFPTGPTVDLLDALASAISMVPMRVPPSRDDDESRSYAAYLREQGVPPSQILRLVRAHRAGEPVPSSHEMGGEGGMVMLDSPFDRGYHEGGYL